MTVQAHPEIIQGGMGVAISDWRLARAVALTGQLGVVAGTALEIVCARRLQDGDLDGAVRRALAAFPAPEVADWIVEAYYVPGGIPAGQAYAAVPRWTLAPSLRLQQLTVAANFVEVYLAREGHDGPVGVNFLRKIELPIPFACYGAMIAGAAYVLMGAGSPADLPGLLRGLAAGQPVAWSVRVQGATSSGAEHAVQLDPARVLGGPVPVLTLPRVLAIVASTDLAAGLAGDPGSRPDGFVVEGPSAGGHNAPPRGPRQTDADGQPVYGTRDEVDVAAVVALGLPVWLAGSYGTPDGLRRAQALGAAGVQVGTAFALCRESGMDATVRRQVLGQLEGGDVAVHSDWRASPTGFPFRVVAVEGSLSDPRVLADRQRVCDLGVLRSPYLTATHKVDYRCPAEPEGVYAGRKAGHAANTAGRVCLCNALMATAGLAQRRPHGYVEPPLVTSGSDFTTVRRLMGPGANGDYPAAAVVAHLLAGTGVPAAGGSGSPPPAFAAGIPSSAGLS